RNSRLCILILPLILGLVACSDNDNSSNTGTFTAPTGKPAGRFEKSANLVASDLEVNYCSEDLIKFDPLLKVGQSIVQVKAEMNVDGTYGRQMFGPVQSIKVLAIQNDTITRR